MSEENKELNKAEINEGEVYTAEEMEQMMPGFKEKIEEAKLKADTEKNGGITIGNRHYTAEQLEWMTKHPVGQMKKWTKDQKKARNKKNKAAAASRKKNRKK